MKKNKLINLILIILIPIVLIMLLISGKIEINSELKELSLSEKKILVEKSYINYAWGYQYRGKAICDDGTIYTWDIDEIYTPYTNSFLPSLEEMGRDTLKKGNKIDKKVSKSDIERLKSLIENLEDDLDTKSEANDAGNNRIQVWRYSDDLRITIKTTGDFTGENKTKEAQEIIRIVNKYLK